MDAKTAKIILYIATLLGLGVIGLLVVFLAAKDLVMGDEGVKQHFNQALICNIAILLAVTSPVGVVFAIWGLIKVFQNDDTPLPLIGGWNIIK